MGRAVIAVSAPLLRYRCGGRDKMREEGRCRMCLLPSERRPLTRHHIVPKSWFASMPFMLRDADANIVPLCRRCHDAVERDPAVRRLLRKVLGADEVAFALQVRGPGWFDRRYPPSVRPTAGPG